MLALRVSPLADGAVPGVARLSVDFCRDMQILSEDSEESTRKTTAQLLLARPYPAIGDMQEGAPPPAREQTEPDREAARVRDG